MSWRVEGEGGNREVSPLLLCDARGDLGRRGRRSVLRERRGFVGETWFPPRDRAEGEEGASMSR